MATAATLGTTFGAPTPGEVLLAEAICERVPGFEQVRLVSSGTEAAISAVRLARGATGSDSIVKFDGCYHGHSDGLLAAGAAASPCSACRARSACRRRGGRHEVVPYNVVPALDDSRGRVHGRAGGGQHEPSRAGAGVPRGPPRRVRPVGALLIFDEVITGFRLGPAGATGRPGSLPDLWCFGKVIGGGLPVGAFGGPAS